MAKSINRYFQFLGSSKEVRSGQLWYPAADVYQTPEGWLVKVELAGVSYHQMEITYSRFEKVLKFPASIEGASVEHNFDNGLLIIHLWKADEAKP
jgi:HSP20 family molecular chaperone IbpA